LGTDAQSTTPGTTEKEAGGDEPPIRFRGDEAALCLAHNDQVIREITRAVQAHPADIEDACAHAWVQFLRYQPSRERNVLLVRANAAELGRVNLPEVLAIVELIRAQEPERFDAAAVRWAGRLALERKALKLRELSHAVRSLAELPDTVARQLLLALADTRRHGHRS
jgi:hypothetical protein